MDQISILKADFKREILTCFPKKAQQEGSGIPLGTILHNIGHAKADIKRAFPQYEIPESDRKNENNKFDWTKFFAEQLPEFTVTHERWKDGKKTDVLRYNYKSTNNDKEEEQTMTTQTVEQTETITPVDKTNLPNRIKTLLKYLNQNLYGKEEAVRLALLSAVAGESIFFIGLPGTAKSMISRRIAAAFSDFYKDGKFNTENGGYFEYLMNEFSTPDEICGPVDLSALNETPSRYTRQTKGYLPSAKVAFLDEIWKSGPAILNTLLTIVNERIFHNGSEIEKVPLISLAAASNELPEKNRGLEALWDRFILRVSVNPVSKEEDFFKVVDDGNTEVISTAELTEVLLSTADVESWQPEINKIELSSEAKNVITAIRKELTSYNKDTKHQGDENYYISDRRWKKIVHLLKTSAFLNGRDSVDLMDCSLIEYCIWNTDKQQSEVGKIIEKILDQHGITGVGNSIGDIVDKIDEFKEAVNEKWFEHIVVKAVAAKPKPYKMKNGTSAYKLISPKQIQSYNSITPTFISEQYHHPNYNRFGAYFTSDGELIGDYDYYVKEFKLQGNKACWKDGYRGYNYEFEIETTTAVPAKDKWELKFFEPVAKKTIMEAFDKKEYIPLANRIDSEIADLQKFRDDSAAPFESNAFAKQRFSGILLQRIDDIILDLKKKKDELESLRTNYATDKNIESKFELCDAIMKDGTYKNANEQKDNENILAKVCLKGDRENVAFGMAWENFDKMNFDTANKYVSKYGKDFPAPYDSGWMLPTIEQWQQIYENSHKKNDFDLSGKYWSSSKDKKQGGVWYFNFDTGEKECTLPSNQYGIAIIRKLAL